MPDVAALYVDTVRGPYRHIPGVVCYGIKEDATAYNGPFPGVYHPPCGAWGALAWSANDDGHTGPIAVAQVRRWGGVLEHPADSRLFDVCGMPAPGWLPDQWGGWTLAVRQCDWGHMAAKATWLYVVGCPRASIPACPPRREPTHHVQARPVAEREAGLPWLPEMPKRLRHLTPPAFAAWLVELARRCSAPAPRLPEPRANACGRSV